MGVGGGWWVVLGVVWGGCVCWFCGGCWCLVFLGGFGGVVLVVCGWWCVVVFCFCGVVFWLCGWLVCGGMGV
ncbi:hypothetical protein [Pseudomonas syringae group genomosp. 7]|uniref:hypothetical protein n=1 Tax=Pseudomonas syringae group genomosp. 7 TaxID=251699 RepID=UPI00377007BA